jgi:hypothetical protein
VARKVRAKHAQPLTTTALALVHQPAAAAEAEAEAEAEAAAEAAAAAHSNITASTSKCRLISDKTTTSPASNPSNTSTASTDRRPILTLTR